MQIRPGDILLVRPAGPSDLFGRLICWATVNPYSHAALAIDTLHVIEALETVRISPAEKYQGRADVYAVNASEEQKHSAVEAARTRLGQVYGLRALLADAERDILHVPVWARLRPQGLTCSGLVAWAYAQAGVLLTHAPLPSPADLSYSPLLLGTRPWEA